MYFGIYDCRTIQNLKTKTDNAILIRILEPSYKITGIPYNIENINNYKNVLELYFHDIINPKLQASTEQIYFSEELAKVLNNFILENEFDEIAIHCSAGISRSPSIGLCVAKILESKKMEDMILSYSHFIPNKQILDAFNLFKYTPKHFSGDVIFRNLEIYEFKGSDLDCNKNGVICISTL